MSGMTLWVLIVVRAFEVLEEKAYWYWVCQTLQISSWFN